MIPIVLQVREGERGIPSDTPSKGPGQKATDLHSDTSRSEAQNWGEHEGQETVVKRPSRVASERISDNNQLDQDPMGECRYRGNILAFVNIC